MGCWRGLLTGLGDHVPDLGFVIINNNLLVKLGVEPDHEHAQVVPDAGPGAVGVVAVEMVAVLLHVLEEGVRAGAVHNHLAPRVRVVAPDGGEVFLRVLAGHAEDLYVAVGQGPDLPQQLGRSLGLVEVNDADCGAAAGDGQLSFVDAQDGDFVDGLVGGLHDVVPPPELHEPRRVQIPHKQIQLIPFPFTLRFPPSQQLINFEDDQGRQSELIVVGGVHKVDDLADDHIVYVRLLQQGCQAFLPFLQARESLGQLVVELHEGAELLIHELGRLLVSPREDHQHALVETAYRLGQQHPVVVVPVLVLFCLLVKRVHLYRLILGLQISEFVLYQAGVLGHDLESLFEPTDLHNLAPCTPVLRNDPSDFFQVETALDGIFRQLHDHEYIVDGPVVLGRMNCSEELIHVELLGGHLHPDECVVQHFFFQLPHEGALLQLGENHFLAVVLAQNPFYQLALSACEVCRTVYNHFQRVRIAALGQECLALFFDGEVAGLGVYFYELQVLSCQPFPNQFGPFFGQHDHVLVLRITDQIACISELAFDEVPGAHTKFPPVVEDLVDFPLGDTLVLGIGHVHRLEQLLGLTVDLGHVMGRRL